MSVLIKSGLLVCLLIFVACGGGGGGGGGGPPRTVSGTFQTTYWADDGMKTTAAPATVKFGGFDVAPTALLVPDGTASGYTKFSLTLDANKSFSIANVPGGTYFLQMDSPTTVQAAGACGPEVEVNIPLLFDTASSAPDLGAVTAARRDVATSTMQTNITVAITGMDAWATGDRIQFASAQGRTNQRAIFFTPPANGVISFTGTSPWFSLGLPDATKHDVVFVYQRATTPVGTGAGVASFHRATRYARLTDFTVADGATSSATVTLNAAPQTGSLSADLRGAQFAALAADVSPEAVPVTSGFNVFGVPHSVSYPDMPRAEVTPVVFLEQPTPADFNYGTLTHGRFLDSSWQEVASVVYSFDVGSVTIAFVCRARQLMSS